MILERPWAANNLTALALAFECVDQDSAFDPFLHAQLDELLDSAYDSDGDPARRRLMAGVLLTRHLREQIRTPAGHRLCVRPIDRAIYSLFLAETKTPEPDAKHSDQPTEEAIVGVRGSDALAFVEWANAITDGTNTYRLPTSGSLNHQLERQARTTLGRGRRNSVWADDGEQQATKKHFLWIPEETQNPHTSSRHELKTAIKNDIVTTIPPNLLEPLSAGLTLMPQVIYNVSSPRKEIDPDLAIARAPAHETTLQNTRWSILRLASTLKEATTEEYQFDNNLSCDLGLALSVVLARMLRRAQRNALRLRHDHSPQISGVTIQYLEDSLERVNSLVTTLIHRIAQNHATFDQMIDGQYWIPDSLAISIDTASKYNPISTALFSEALAEALASSAYIYDEQWEMIIGPDGLSTSLTRAVDCFDKELEGAAYPSSQELLRPETAPPASWLRRVAEKLEGEAGSVFTREAKVTSQVSTSIRLAALILAHGPGKFDFRT